MVSVVVRKDEPFEKVVRRFRREVERAAMLDMGKDYNLKVVFALTTGRLPSMYLRRKTTYC